jgi:DNA repair protein RecO (recombination protein O)
MQFLTDEGFVIKRVNFGEADRYITVYSRNNGKLELIAKGVRKITSRRSSHIEPLHRIKFNSVKGKNSYILTEAQLIQGFHDRDVTLEQLSSRFLICELMDKLCPVNQQSEPIYDLLQYTLARIQKGDIPSLIQEFQVQLLTNLGYWDSDKKFYDEHDTRNFIESIIEKRLKTKLYFEF